MGQETSLRHPDSLDPRFQRLFTDEYNSLADMIPGIFTLPGHSGRADIRWTDVGELDDFVELSGQVDYDQQYDGFDTVATYVEFAKGTQYERKLMDDEQYHVFDQKPVAMARAAHRTRQKHGAQAYNLAFSVNPSFYVNSEGVALCSNSHTTNSGASTASGFDNLGTDALSATAVETARQAMVGYRDDRANRISVTPDQITVGPAGTEVAWEIVHSRGKLNSAENNANFHEGNYQILTWNYITDTNDWFMEDSALRKDSLFWSDRIPLEHAMVEDFDTFVAKWRGYMRYAHAHRNWRWIFGSQVS
jgi:hypothetical protein